LLRLKKQGSKFRAGKCHSAHRHARQHILTCHLALAWVASRQSWSFPLLAPLLAGRKQSFAAKQETESESGDSIIRSAGNPSCVY
jgi:hypothetical protein